MSEEPVAAVHSRHVKANPVVEVDIDGPRGTFRGLATGWTGDRVHLRWTEGPGMIYVQVLPAARVRRI